MSVEDAGVLPDPMHPDDCDERITVRVDGDRVEELDDMVENGRFRNRSHAIRYMMHRVLKEEQQRVAEQADQAEHDDGSERTSDTAHTPDDDD